MDAKAFDDGCADCGVPERFETRLRTRTLRPDSVCAEPRQTRPFDRRLPVRDEYLLVEELAIESPDVHHVTM
jgi:hypothetical protein